MRGVAEADWRVIAPLRDLEPDPIMKEKLRLIYTTCIRSVQSKVWLIKQVRQPLIGTVYYLANISSSLLASLRVN